MPHDAHGREIKPGDQVVLRGTVREVYGDGSADGTSGCNAVIDLADPAGVLDFGATHCCNARLLEVVEPPPAAEETERQDAETAKKIAQEKPEAAGDRRKKPRA